MMAGIKRSLWALMVLAVILWGAAAAAAAHRVFL